MLVGLVMAVGSCADGHGPAPEPSRVLLVYIGTDNNLSGLEQNKLQALREGWTGKSTDRIIVYRDTKDNGARLIEISNLSPNDSPHEIAVYGQENSASADVLKRVINDVAELYPADSYGLLVFSHASGWLPQGTLSNGTLSTRMALGDPASGRSVITDGSQEMELADFADAIPNGLFSYIVFETCFMAGVEVAYELKDKADYILASGAEIIDPGFAPVYAAATSKLFDQDITGFAGQVFDYTLSYPEGDLRRSGTYSVIKTAELESLAGFIKNNCNLSLDINIAGIQHFDRLKDHHLFFDFEDYYIRLLHDESKAEELSRLINRCVVWKAATKEFMTQVDGYNGFSIHSHSGLTTYIRQPRFTRLKLAYSNLSWANDIENREETQR